MQDVGQGVPTLKELISERRSAGAPIDGKALIVHLNNERRRDLRKARRFHHFKAIPESHFLGLKGLKRGRYRAIVVSTYLSLLWDGWKSKKKTRRKPTKKVMATRRMFANHFNMCASTVEKALRDLVVLGKIVVAQKHVYSGKRGKNMGTCYRLPWMENPKGKNLKVYWGLLVSDSFFRLGVTLQAVTILLHSLHNRTKNRLTIRPGALEKFGIHRNRLPGYVSELQKAGLLIYIEGRDYEFTWIDSEGYPNFSRIENFDPPKLDR